MIRRRFAVGMLLACSLGPAPPISAQSDAPYSWVDVERLIAIGDVHGAYDNLVRTVRAMGLVDSQLAWSGGEAHLVFVGDLVDRGPQDRSVMDLVRRLQQEAPQSGGRVHLVLGNHEVMCLTGDLRYVSPESFAQFAPDETRKDRDAGWNRFRAENGDGADVRAAFDKERPPGYFAHRRAFEPDGEYGSWLLEQPTVVRINGVLFVHGGITEPVAKLGLENINQAVWDDIRRWRGRPRTKQMFDDLAFAPDGPLWYRGYSLDHERDVRTELNDVLERLDARALVVGHTPTNTDRISARFNFRLYRVDVGMGYGAEPFALVFDDGAGRSFDPRTLARTEIVLEAAQGEGWSAVQEDLPDAAMAEFLALGKVRKVVELARQGREIKLVDLEWEGLELRVLFQFVEETPPDGTPPEEWNPRRYQHEIAAYRLDRMLDLRMVPVSVERKLKRQRGAISYWTRASIDLLYIREHDRRDLLQGIRAQIADARAFTALIGSRDRHDAAKMLAPPERAIVLADNSKAFPLDESIDDQIVVEEMGERFDLCDMGADLALAMRLLARPALQQELGDYLSVAQIDALLVRRDRILESCTVRGNVPASQ